MGERIRAFDWSRHPFGAPETWPPALRVALGICLNSSFPTAIYWGPELRLLYNDAWSHIPAERHPGALGQPGKDVWSDIWEVVGPQFQTVLDTATGFSTFDQMLPMQRRGVAQETYWNYSFTPILDENGRVAGVFNQGHETTAIIMAARARAAETERLRETFAQAPGAIAVLSGPDHRFEIANQAYVDLIGGRENILGRPLAEALPEVVEQGFVDLLDRVRRTGEAYIGNNIAVELVRNGQRETRILDFIYQPTRSASGELASIFVQATDVTERALGEQELRRAAEERAFLDRLAQETQGLDDADAILVKTTQLTGAYMDASVCAYADMDEDGNGFTIRGDWAAPGSRSIVGRYTLEDFGKMAVQNLRAGLPLILNDNAQDIAPDEAKAFQDIGIAATICMPLVKQGRLTALMAVHQRSPRVWTEAEISLLREVTERSWAHIERVSAARQARESGQRYRALFDAIDEGFCIIEFLDGPYGPLSDYIHIEANPAYTANAGIPNVVGQKVRDMVPEEAQAWVDRYREVLLTGEPIRFEQELAATGRWLELAAFRVEPASRKQVAVLFKDLTARKRAEDALKELNANLEQRIAEGLAERKLLSDIIQSADAFVQVADNDLRWLALNDAAEREFVRVFGVAPKVGVRMSEVLAHRPEEAAGLEQLWRRALREAPFIDIQEYGGDDRRSYEVRFYPLLDAAGERIGAFLIGYDVTERLREQARLRETEAALRQAQKMEAIGQLTGGIAHDFNNMLAVVIGGLNLMQRRMARGETNVSQYVDAAMDGATRASALTQRLLAFSRQQPLEPRVLDVNKLVASMTELLARTLGEHIQIETVLSPGLWRCFADPIQLESAILNLAVNARDAMPEGGKLTIDANNAMVDEKVARDYALPEGQYVMVAITDTGSGMTPEVMAQAFEPFFTTKSVGKGTGLGLSQVFGFVRQSGGHVKLYSEIGVGTTVKLYLPRFTGTDPESVLPSALAQPASGSQSETVLVVEDEERVRNYSVEALKELGYQVIAAASPVQALRLIESGQSFTLLFTDIVMPEMNGRQLADIATAKLPGLKVLFTTGYTRNAIVHNGMLDAGTSVLQKPFTLDQLAAKVRSVLDS